jgi:hypothetical protein
MAVYIREDSSGKNPISPLAVCAKQMTIQQPLAAHPMQAAVKKNK